MDLPLCPKGYLKASTHAISARVFKTAKMTHRLKDHKHVSTQRWSALQGRKWFDREGGAGRRQVRVANLNRSAARILLSNFGSHQCRTFIWPHIVKNRKGKRVVCFSRAWACLKCHNCRIKKSAMRRAKSDPSVIPDWEWRRLPN